MAKKSKRKFIQINYDNGNDDDNISLNKKLLIDNDDDDNNKKMAPKNWLELYQKILKLRSKIIAPVDTMGCDQCYDKNKIIDDKQKRFQILISLLLSSQTKDQITYTTMEKLCSKNLSIEFINQISQDELMNLIKSVGFYRRKAQYIKQVAKILQENYNNDIPNNIDELKKLPGVGPKMAYLAMNIAWNKISGIAVDTHVHRISNRLHWVKTKTPEQTRLELEKWLPKKYWNEINHLFVGFGQTICLPIKPKCNDCIINKQCPSVLEF